MLLYYVYCIYFINIVVQNFGLLSRFYKHHFIFARLVRVSFFIYSRSDKQQNVSSLNLHESADFNFRRINSGCIFKVLYVNDLQRNNKRLILGAESLHRLHEFPRVTSQ